MMRAAIEHLQGVRLALQGDYGEAETLLRAADERVTYIEAGLLRSSSSYESAWSLPSSCWPTGRMRRRTDCWPRSAGVNPLWVAEFQDSGFKMLGLDRG